MAGGSGSRDWRNRRCWYDCSGRNHNCRYDSDSASACGLIASICVDKVPLRSVATWRGYVNIASTVGRSAGGPMGGYLADTIGWRW